jgi:hypothetical protein
MVVASCMASCSRHSLALAALINALLLQRPLLAARKAHSMLPFALFNLPFTVTTCLPGCSENVRAYVLV